jgi:hypothetical protein
MDAPENVVPVIIDLTVEDPPEDPEVVQERKRARREASALERRRTQMIASTAVENAIRDDLLRNHERETIGEVVTREELIDRVKCAVCFKKYRSVVLLPCRHMATCFDCIVQIRDRNSHCPLCNETFDQHMNVYY